MAKTLLQRWWSRLNSIQVTEQKVRGKGGNIVVRANNGSIELLLPAGVTRTFTVEKLKEVVSNFQLINDYGDIWLEVKDSGGQTLAITFKKDRAFVEPIAKGDPDYSVSVNLLEKALNKAIQESPDSGS